MISEARKSLISLAFEGFSPSAATIRQHFPMIYKKRAN